METCTVEAKCLAQAWGPMAGTTQCAMYYPGRGPLPGGAYEIEPGTGLDKLTTPTGEWIFQYPGHEGKDPNYQKRIDEERKIYQNKAASRAA